MPTGFKATERIDGYIYIIDPQNNKVSVNGKLKRFKTVDAAAMFIFRLEQALKTQKEQEKH